jgi:hypothetical protein
VLAIALAIALREILITAARSRAELRRERIEPASPLNGGIDHTRP